jgi:hypothetical protein
VNYEEKFKKAQAAVIRFVNAQGRHISDSWKQHFIAECELEVDDVNPYEPVRPRLPKDNKCRNYDNCLNYTPTEFCSNACAQKVTRGT